MIESLIREVRGSVALNKMVKKGCRELYRQPYAHL